MPTITLTDISVRKLQAPETGAKIYVDKSLSGFGIRVTARGVKSYVLTYGPSRQRVTLGRVGIVSLSDARTEAKRRLAEHTLGHARPRRTTYPEAVKRYLEDIAPRLREKTVAEYRYLLNRHFKFGDAQLAATTQEDFTRRIDKPHATAGMQNHAFVGFCQNLAVG